MSDDFVEDSDRSARIGLDESIFCAAKSAEQISQIIFQLSENNKRALFTRLSSAVFSQIEDDRRKLLKYDKGSLTAILGESKDELKAELVAIVSAGTSDAQVVAEANKTLEYYGVQASVYQDVGVAGLWRVLRLVDILKRYPIIIAVAGMDAALPTILAGLVPSSIIAVPTSVGYGIAQGGTVALNSLLASCAPGLVVVNIDNGFGAACAALRILNNFDRSTTGHDPKIAKDKTISH